MKYFCRRLPVASDKPPSYWRCWHPDAVIPGISRDTEMMAEHRYPSCPEGIMRLPNLWAHWIAKICHQITLVCPLDSNWLKVRKTTLLYTSKTRAARIELKHEKDDSISQKPSACFCLSRRWSRKRSRNPRSERTKWIGNGLVNETVWYSLIYFCQWRRHLRL